MYNDNKTEKKIMDSCKVKNVKVVFIDIDDTVFSFSEFVKKTMQDGFKKYGLKPSFRKLIMNCGDVSNKTP